MINKEICLNHHLIVLNFDFAVSFRMNFRHPMSKISPFVTLLICCLVMCSNLFSSPLTPDSITRSDVRFIARGKVAAFFIVEDLFFRTGTIGVEVVYKNENSMGLDFTIFRWREAFDNDQDVALYEKMEKRIYMHLD